MYSKKQKRESRPKQSESLISAWQWGERKQGTGIDWGNTQGDNESCDPSPITSSAHNGSPQHGHDLSQNKTLKFNKPHRPTASERFGFNKKKSVLLVIHKWTSMFSTTTHPSSSALHGRWLESWEVQIKCRILRVVFWFFLMPLGLIQRDRLVLFVPLRCWQLV